MCLIFPLPRALTRHAILSARKLRRRFLVLHISRVVARVYGAKLPLAAIGGKPANKQAGKYGEVMRVRDAHEISYGVHAVLDIGTGDIASCELSDCVGYML